MFTESSSAARKPIHSIGCYVSFFKAFFLKKNRDGPKVLLTLATMTFQIKQ